MQHFAICMQSFVTKLFYYLVIYNFVYLLKHVLGIFQIYNLTNSFVHKLPTFSCVKL